MAEYFQHDYSCRNHPKMVALISDHGALGYGIFWAIAEYTHEVEHHSIKQQYEFQALAKQMSTGVEQVLNIVEDCINKYSLLTRDEDGSVVSRRTFENLVKRDETRENKSKAGKASADAKKAKLEALNQQKSTAVKQDSTGVQQKSTKERKGKEIKEKEKKGEIEPNDFSHLNPTWDIFWDKVVELNSKLNPPGIEQLIRNYAQAQFQAYEEASKIRPGGRWADSNGQIVGDNWPSKLAHKVPDWATKSHKESKKNPSETPTTLKKSW